MCLAAKCDFTHSEKRAAIAALRALLAHPSPATARPSGDARQYVPPAFAVAGELKSEKTA